MGECHISLQILEGEKEKEKARQKQRDLLTPNIELRFTSPNKVYVF